MEKTGENNSAARKKPVWIKIMIAVVVVAGIIILAKVLNVGKQLDNLDMFIKKLGPWGPLVFIAIYIGCTVAAVPGTILTVVAGTLFGSFFGVIYVSIGSTIGASLAFLVSRYFARNAVVKSLSKNEKFNKLDKLTKEHGSIIVAITRLVPIFPFNMLNYGFGLTRIKFRTYAFWSWLCMLPGTVLYVVVPDGFKKLLQTGRPPLLLVIVLVMDVLILTFLVRRAKKKLDLEKAAKEAVQQAESKTGELIKGREGT